MDIGIITALRVPWVGGGGTVRVQFLGGEVAANFAEETARTFARRQILL